MKAYVGVTDIDWYRFLSARPTLQEVNFWRPHGGRPFRALDAGDPFIFKTKAPHSRVVGGGIYEGFVALPLSRAWEFFGEGNGVSGVEDLVERIRSITHESREQIGDREIGCVLLRGVYFFLPGSQLPTPRSFAPNIVQGRTYECPGEDQTVDAAVRLILAHDESVNELEADVENFAPTRGEQRLMTPRLGQAGFKAIVQEAYGRRCAVTGHKILPTLQAAHVVPVAEGGQHRVDNGLLLRSDVHTLFDRGYLGIDDNFRLLVSPRLRSEFGNGDEFYAREGSAISLPINLRERPSEEFLSWHLEKVFR